MIMKTADSNQYFLLIVDQNSLSHQLQADRLDFLFELVDVVLSYTTA